MAQSCSRLYCDSDSRMYGCLFESWKAVWKGWQAFDGDSLVLSLWRAFKHEMYHVIDLLYI